MCEVSVFDDNKLYSQDQIAPIFGKSEAWLERARWAGTGPAFIKIGRNVRYAGRSLNEYLSAGVRTSTTQDAA